MKIAVIICNFNGKEYVINCIESLQKQTYMNFDIYLIDNKSTDGTCEAVEKLYGDKVFIHKNKENLGGTGGFNTGLKMCVEQGYDYALMLDNDVVLGTDVVEKLFNRMKDDSTIGILGSKIKIMDAPEHIQEYGSWIDKDKCEIYLGYHFMYDTGLPELIECDYVPACVAMVNLKVVRQVGVMPEDNFIYWDDIEFCYNIRQAGYKVAALGTTNAWHRGGFKRKVTSTFGAYYYTRNRIDYFLKTTDNKELKRVSSILVKNVFQYIYGCYHKKLNEVAKSRLHALVDGFAGVRGKQEAKVYGYSPTDIKLGHLLQGEVYVFLKDLKEKEVERIPDVVNSILGKFRSMGSTAKYIITLENSDYVYDEYMRNIHFTSEDTYSNEIVEAVIEKKENSKILEIHNHVTEVKQYNPEHFYVDKYFNEIVSIEDFDYFSEYEKRETEFEKWFFEEMEKKQLSYESAENKIRELLSSHNSKEVIGSEY